MPTDLLLRRVNWDYVFPELTPLLFELVARCRKRGVDYYAICGYRTYAEQQQQYNIGRVVLLAPDGRKLKIVTNARPGQSAHNFGLAGDFCRDADLARDGLQPDWNLPDYEVLAEEARGLGLDAAFYWNTFKEGPHVQLDLKAKGIELAELDRIFRRRSRLQDVWDFLSLRGPWS